MLRRFRFNLPQRIAAGLLAALPPSGVLARQPPDAHRPATINTLAAAAKPGKSPRPSPATSPPAATFTTAFSPTASPAFPSRSISSPSAHSTSFASPKIASCRTRQASSAPGNSATRSPTSCLLLRLPFLFAGFLLGACIWWVTRRLYGNFGGYTALALYCFSPPILKACVAPDPEVFAALGVLRRSLHMHRRCSFHAVPATQMASARRSSHRDSWRRRCRTHRRPSRRSASRPRFNALGRRRPSQPDPPHRPRRFGRRARSSSSPATTSPLTPSVTSFAPARDSSLSPSIRHAASSQHSQTPASRSPPPRPLSFISLLAVPAILETPLRSSAHSSSWRSS